MLGAMRSAAARGATKAARQMRRMSSKASIEEELKEMSKWRVITYAAIPMCIAKGVYDFSHDHAHGEEPPAYPFLHIRNKAFPWGPDGLFESKHH